MRLFKSRKKNVCFEIWQQPILPILVSNPFHAWGREASRPARRMGPACRTWPGGAACKFDRQSRFVFVFVSVFHRMRGEFRSEALWGGKAVFSQPQVVTRAEGRPLSLPPFVSLWSRLCPWTAPPPLPPPLFLPSFWFPGWEGLVWLSLRPLCGLSGPQSITAPTPQPQALCSLGGCLKGPL